MSDFGSVTDGFTPRWGHVGIYGEGKFDASVSKLLTEVQPTGGNLSRFEQ